MQILISMHFIEMFAFTLHVLGIILRIPSHYIITLQFRYY